jgi:hypothetical protein
MDDVIYEEFKGTGNMEIHLDRRMAEKRTYPAINVNRSWERARRAAPKQDVLQKVWYRESFYPWMTSRRPNSWSTRSSRRKKRGIFRLDAPRLRAVAVARAEREARCPGRQTWTPGFAITQPGLRVPTHLERRRPSPILVLSGLFDGVAMQRKQVHNFLLM